MQHGSNGRISGAIGEERRGPVETVVLDAHGRRTKIDLLTRSVGLEGFGNALNADRISQKVQH